MSQEQNNGVETAIPPKARKGVARKSAAKKASKRRSGKKYVGRGTKVAYPKHAIANALRIPRAILEQNAGKECSEKEAGTFIGAKITGPVAVELSSAKKFGFIQRPSAGRLAITELAKRVLRPQKQSDEVDGLREAVNNAPVFKEVYQHYRGENLPDAQFLDNALTDNFGVPLEGVSEFKTVFIESLRSAKLIEEANGKIRVLDAGQPGASIGGTSDALKRLERTVSVAVGDSCFVVMPFAKPLGEHYRLLYEPAISKAGLRAVRADDDIFATGKIMDQVWAGISAAKVLVAELTGRNPNVFYELGLAHALKKPVVLVSASEEDVPFDVRHIRVIYYDVRDPFWGQKLIEKVAENILSALKNPEEAIFHTKP